MANIQLMTEKWKKTIQVGIRADDTLRLVGIHRQDIQTTKIITIRAATIRAENQVIQAEIA